MFALLQGTVGGGLRMQEKKEGATGTEAQDA